MCKILYTLLKHILFPEFCVICGLPGSTLCSNCLNYRLIYLARAYCPLCQGRLQKGQYIHRLCKKNSSLDGCFSVLFYEKNFAKVIKSYKYELQQSLIPSLSSLLEARILSLPVPFELLVPLPQHLSRKNWRGFDHIAALALRLPGTKLCPCLIKTKKTANQAGLGRNERLKNPAGSFSFVSQYKIEGRNLLLLDDIYTTGATAEAAASTLKANGAAKVFYLSLAKDDRDFRQRVVK